MATPYQKALSAIDAAHAADPRVTTTTDGQQVPYELHYARKMTSYLEKVDPNASEVLRLAIRAQHLRRWEVPRDTYPMTRPGYFSWRTALKKRQAELGQQICLDSGLSASDAERIAALIRKENLKADTETQTLEDVACLVFLDDQFEEFEKNYDEEKIISILKKTWVKMSDRAHDLALQIDLSERAKGLVGRALAG
ncbi:hypothetical protein L228DRAFT_264835 [Xylona heveae TC161]|uniref:Glutamyl-tRNA synthetase n=1 Tax=Xylona heveae (strain CBS 132557 / TC161) TaxID=1328760 RepID=A0A165JN30_XYLHT|nr:hypothetical protein L228DRAFT_264835 [Xylona heveae TC161]KZF26438.1 hypothetical protein L228DRAFT_264835 [Xylona heveae TC161]